MSQSLIDKYLQILSPVAKTLSSVGKAVSTPIPSPLAGFGKALMAPNTAKGIGGKTVSTDTGYSPLPTATYGSTYYNLLKPAAQLQQGVGAYAQHQIVQPAISFNKGIQSPNLATKGMALLSGAQSIYNTTPAGIGQNVLFGSVAGAARTARTGQPLASSIGQGITQPTSVASQGLGIKNPVLSLALDTALMSPEGSIKSIKGIKGIAQSIYRKPVADDAKFLDEAVSVIRNAKSDLGSRIKATADIDQLLKDHIQERLPVEQFAKLAKAHINEKIRVLQKYLKNADTFNIPKIEVGKKQSLVGSQEPLPWETSANLHPSLPTTEKPPAVRIPVDQQTQLQAEARTVLGNNGQGGIQGLMPDIRNAFSDWVNAQKASRVEGAVKSKEFSDLNGKGLQGIFEFQAGNKEGRYGDVKTYFDQKYKQLQDAGVTFGYKQDYLPQLWADPQEQVAQVFGKALGTRPSFTLESIIKDYQTGIEAGLTPRFQNIGDLVGWYEGKANKALADKGFFDYLGRDGFIQPASKAPQDWVTLTPDRFPKIKTTFDGKEYVGTYKAPPELAKLVNNYLNPAGFSQLAKVADYVSMIKNRVLSFGVPNTGINAHGFNILARSTIADKNPVMGFLKAGYYMLRPQAAEDFIAKNLGSAPFAVRHGLTFSVEDHKVLTDAPTVSGKIGQKWNEWFEEPLFNKMLPALKLSYFNDLSKEYGKSIGQEQGAKEAAKVANAIFGGYNWEQLGKSRDMQNLKRALILAPDWATTNLQLGQGIVKGLIDPRNPAGKAYRRVATNLMGAYVLANAVNKIQSGHFMFQNDPGHTFEIEGGYTEDGQKRYIRPFGTAADFVRLPYDIALGFAKGDPTPAFRAIANRLSIPLSSTMHLATNTDYLGNPIYGRDKYGNPLTPLQSAGGIASEVGGLVGEPSYLKNMIDYQTGKLGKEQAFLQGLELPVRYSGGATNSVQKQLRGLAGAEGMQGKQLYDFYKSLKGQKKFSDNQYEYIQQEGTKGAQDILELRKVNSAVKKLENGEDLTPEELHLLGQVQAADQPAAKHNSQVAEQIARAKVKLNGGVQETSDKYFYKSDAGKITGIPKDRQVQEPKLTGNEELDKELISKYKGELTTKANDILTLYKLGKLSKDDAETQLTALKAKKDALAKPKKPKKPKAITVKAVKLSVPKAPRRAKIKAVKPSQTKVYKLKKVHLTSSKQPNIVRSALSGR